jgi:hypothetical protein
MARNMTVKRALLNQKNKHDRNNVLSFLKKTMRNVIIAAIFVVVFTVSLNAQAVRQDVADDGYTWFEASPAQDLAGNNIPTAKGWMLKS